MMDKLAVAHFGSVLPTNPSEGLKLQHLAKLHALQTPQKHHCKFCPQCDQNYTRASYNVCVCVCMSYKFNQIRSWIQ